MSELADLESKLRRQFDMVRTEVKLGDRTLAMWHPRSADELLDEAAFNRDGRIPYWADIWPAARVLAAKILATKGNGRRLLELGCGAGLMAVASTAAGYEVTATDYYPEALEFVRLNALVNDLLPPTTRCVDWRNWPDDLGAFDRVVAADVLYEPEHAPLVAAAIARSLLPSGEAWITDPRRRHAEVFPKACQLVGLRVIEHTIQLFDHGQTQVTIDSYIVHRA